MNTMKTIITFITYLLIVCQGTAQTCDFIKNESDKFTKEKTLHTKPIKITSEKIKQKKTFSIDKVEVQLKYENSKYLIYLSYYFGQGLSVANTNDKLILLLTDGTTVSAPCVQNMPDQRGNAFTSILSYNFQLSEEDLNRLSTTDVTDIRMTAQINPIDFSIAKEIKTSKLFSCIIQNK